MKQILFYYIIFLTIFTEAGLQSAVTSNNSSPNHTKLRRTSDSLSEIARRRQSQSTVHDNLIEHLNTEDLNENFLPIDNSSQFNPFGRSRTSIFNTSINPTDQLERSNNSALNSSLTDNVGSRKTALSPSQKLARARKSITFIEKKPNNTQNLFNDAATNTSVLEITTPDHQTNITQNKPHKSSFLSRMIYVEGATVSMLCGLFAYMNHLKQEESRASQKRFITGFEPMVAGAALKGILSYGSTAISLALATYSLWRIKRWVHSSCRTDQRLLEERFEAQLTQHITEVNTGFTQINNDITTIAGDVGTIAEVLETILPPEQAQEMQSITHNTEAIQNQNVIRFKTPKEKKCCGSSCNIF